MIKYFKKIFYKKKLAGITICFLSAIFLMPILSVSALGEQIPPIYQRPLNDNLFFTNSFKDNLIKNDYLDLYNVLIDYYNNNLADVYDSYVIRANIRAFGAPFENLFAEKPILIYFNKKDVVSDFLLRSSNNNVFAFFVDLEFSNSLSKINSLYYNDNNEIVFNTINLSSNKRYTLYSVYLSPEVSSDIQFFFETNLNKRLIWNPGPAGSNTIIFKNEFYNNGDVMYDDLSFSINDDYISARKLYNFQIDLENQSHLDYTHSLRFNYGDYIQNPIFKGFEFIGLTNNNGLYYWEETDKCYINNNDYQIVSNNDYFEVNISNIKGDCLSYYDKVKLIVNLDNLMLKDIPNIQGDSNAMGYFNFLSYSSVVDVFSNYKYVNFTTNKNNVKFDLLVKESFDGKFENRHFFKYFDKNNLKTTDEYVNNHIGPYPVYKNMYKLHNVILDKNKGLTVFKMDVMDNEVFIYEYKDVYYSLTNNDFNKNVKIIDEEGIPQEVDIDVEYPDPPSEIITDINVGVGSLKDGISAVHTLYSTFYNNLTVEFKILHNLFFTLLIISIVIKVVLK